MNDETINNINTNNTGDYLFYPVYSQAITSLGDYYITVSMKSAAMKSQSQFKRKKLNLVIVLDISNSMDSPMNEYFTNDINKQADKFITMAMGYNT